MQRQTQVTGNELLQQNKKRQNWRLIAWVLAISLLIAALLGALWNKKYGKYHNPDLYYGVRVTDKDTELQAESSRKGYLANAMALRDQWRPWAQQHKALLSYMLQANPSDQAAFNHVYYALPSTPTEASMPPITADLKHPSSTDFSWQLIDKDDNAMLSMRDPEVRSELAKHHARFSHDLQENFLQFHDIVVSNSMSRGMSVLTLWASGRVTEKTLLRQYIPGKPVFVESIPHQVVPPYDFLDKKETKT